MRHEPVVKGQGVSPAKSARAREFRKEPTPSERLLWKQLRANRTGFHFRRQQGIQGFITDFVCVEARVVVEVDGDVHVSQVAEDKQRAAVFEALGFLVLRFTNDDVEHNPAEVTHRITTVCERRAQRDP